jgi:CubicO group peptidase (beta-lactamase class C family)
MALAQSPTTAEATLRSEALATRLGDQLKQLGIPGAAIAVWNRGEVIEAAAGWANVEAGIAADTRTIFQIGSITKVFTATLIVRLAELGRVALDAPARAYLPALKLAGKPAPDTLTVRSLLDYSSGVAGEYFADFGAGTDALARYVDACADLPFLFKPGTMRAYSSTAYCIAGRVVEAVTGLDYERALVDYLLEPLGLERYAFSRGDVARFRTAIGHHRNEAGELVGAQSLHLPYAMCASGASLAMSAIDLLRFGLLHLRAGVAVNGDRLVSPAGIAAMITPSRIVPPNDSELIMGWATLPTDKGRMVAASGATVEQNAFLVHLPDQDFAMAILANAAGGGQALLMTLGREVLQACAGATPSFPNADVGDGPAPTALDPTQYCGEYTNHTRATVLPDDDGLRAIVTAKETTSDRIVSQTLKLRPLGDHRFATTLDGSGAPGPSLQFLFMAGEGRASHVAMPGGRVFARCDADGRTGVLAS